MAVTPLHRVFASSGADVGIGEFGGAETAATFGDLAREFAALRSSAAVFDLGRRAKIMVSGNDRVRWVNGMVTNNTRGVAGSRGSYNFLLNAQGHILADMYIYNRGESLLVDTDLSQAERVRELFDKYIIMDEVEIADADEKLTAIGLVGPRATEVFSKLGISPPNEALSIAEANWDGANIVVVRGDARNTFEIWIAPEKVASL